MRTTLMIHLPGHAGPFWPDDAEHCDTIREARAVLKLKANGPLVERPEDAMAYVYLGGRDLSDPDPYPDEVWTLGPRGGIVRSKA